MLTARELTVLTMGMLAHNDLSHSGELLELKVGDISWNTLTACRVRIVTSRADPFRLPEVVPLVNYADFSASICLRHYWDMFKVDSWDPEALLFRRDPSVLGSPALSKDLFIKGFRGLLCLCLSGLPLAQFSGHSFRAGGATDWYHGAIPTCFSCKDVGNRTLSGSTCVIDLTSARLRSARPSLAWYSDLVSDGAAQSRGFGSGVFFLVWGDHPWPVHRAGTCHLGGSYGPCSGSCWGNTRKQRNKHGPYVVRLPPKQAQGLFDSCGSLTIIPSLATGA